MAGPMAETLASTSAKLEALVGRTELISPALLAKPSALHLRKILAAVNATTGFGAGAFSSDRDGDSLGDEEFFTRLLHLVVFSLDVPEPRLLEQISVSGLVAATDPAAAHLLLQKLVEAVTSKESRKRWAPKPPEETPEKGVAPRPKPLRCSKISQESEREMRQRRWHARLRVLPGFGVDEADTEAKSLRDRLADLVAQLEEFAEEIIETARKAELDVSEVCHAIKEEVFEKTSECASRNKASYAYKHIHGNPSEMYEMGAQVGSGAFGSVHKAVHRQTREDHAVKCITKAKVSNTDSLWAEMDMVKQLDHPHIMRMYNTFEDETTLFMTTELCEGGAFFETLRESGNLDESVAARLFKQIIGVVSYLHSRSICHRDLKPENFLVHRKSVVQHMHLKLIDFGTAKRYDLSPMVTKICTPHYCAPEVLKPKLEPYSEKVDVWSCGVMLFTMLSGRLPFYRENQVELLKLVKKGKYEFEPKHIWSTISKSAQELIAEILCLKVDERCTADQAFHHAWVHSALMRRKSYRECDERISKHLVEGMHHFLTTNRLKRVALRIIARQISDESIERLRSIFLSIDNDNSGSITIDEMTEAVSQLDVDDWSRAGMVEIMCQLDPTGSGKVEYTEFLAASMSKQMYLKEDVCKAAFLRLDSDGDGVLTRRDLGRLLSDRDGMRDAGLTGASLTELISELEHIMDEADEDKNGGVSFEEFMQLMDDDGHLPVRSAMESRQKRGSFNEKTKVQGYALSNAMAKYQDDGEYEEDT